jgi:hypothetical protein
LSYIVDRLVVIAAAVVCAASLLVIMGCQHSAPVVETRAGNASTGATTTNALSGSASVTDKKVPQHQKSGTTTTTTTTAATTKSRVDQYKQQLEEQERNPLLQEENVLRNETNKTTNDTNIPNAAAVAPVHNSDDSHDPSYTQPRCNDDFTTDYIVLKQIMGGISALSNIYMVMKRPLPNDSPNDHIPVPPSVSSPHEQPTNDIVTSHDEKAGTTASTTPLQTNDEHNTDGTMTNNDGIYVLQVIDMYSVAPERRKSMRKEIIALKSIVHPNSTYRWFAYHNIYIYIYMYIDVLEIIQVVIRT